MGYGGMDTVGLRILGKYTTNYHFAARFYIFVQLFTQTIIILKKILLVDKYNLPHQNKKITDDDYIQFHSHPSIHITHRQTVNFSQVKLKQVSHSTATQHNSV